MNALEWFRSGHDYVEISNLLGISEAQVEKDIHQLREEESPLERRRAYGRDYMRRQRAEGRA